MVTISTEDQEDSWEVEYLFDLSFAPGREMLSSYRLREGNTPIQELCLTARDATGALVGAIRYYPIKIGLNEDPALLLGPIAVHPTVQGEGVGSELMQKSLKLAAQKGWERVVLVGDAPYYQRFGFEKAQNLGFPPPVNLERLLVKPLIKNAFTKVTGDIKLP